MFKHILLLSAILCWLGIEAKGLPSFVPLCKRTDPNLEKCILKAVDALRPRFKQGIPELGIPSMNPLIIPYAGLNAGPTFNASFKNIEVFNADEFKIDELKVDLEKVHLEIAVSFPKLRIKSEYSINGKILFIELKGNGPADGNFTNIRAVVNADGKMIDKKGKKHIEIAEVKVDGKYGKPVFVFADLFEDPQVTDQTNKIINENIEEIIKELEPVVNKVVIEIAQSLVSRVFSKYSFDELFPL